MLECRRVALSDDQRATIHACSDPVTLEHWIERAATATNADALFDGER